MLADVLGLLGKLPENCYLKTNIQVDEKTHRRAIVCCLFMEPPEDGWPNRAAYFRHPPDNWDAKVTEFPWKHDDSVLGGMSVWADEPEEFFDILKGMLKDIFASFDQT